MAELDFSPFGIQQDVYLRRTKCVLTVRENTRPFPFPFDRFESDRTPSKTLAELLHGFIVATSADKTTRTGSRAKRVIRCSKNAFTQRAKIKLRG